MTRYYFVHISKTGGTSLRNAVSSSLPRHEVFFVSVGDFHAALAEVDVAGLRVVGGHVPHWEFARSSPLRQYKWQAFTVVRDPVDRLLSLFHYLTVSDHPDHSRFRGLDLRRFCDVVAARERPDLYMCYYFSPQCSYAESREVILGEQISVYVMEEMTSLRTVLSRRLGVALEERRDNQSQRRATRDDLRSIDLGFLEEDASLYAAAARGEFPRLP